MTDWDARFMALAEHVAGWSKDRSTRIGAVIVDPNSKVVLSTGWNGFPRGADDDVEKRHARPLKYSWSEHAERNAIYNAARLGVGLAGATIYVPLFPCVDCARAIIQCGISTLVTTKPDYPDDGTWRSLVPVSVEMLSECGVAVRFIELERRE